MFGALNTGINSSIDYDNKNNINPNLQKLGIFTLFYFFGD